jgi:hypothetical protein
MNCISKKHDSPKQYSFYSIPYYVLLLENLQTTIREEEITSKMDRLYFSSSLI